MQSAILLKHIEENMGETDLDLTKPFLQVGVFRLSGKWYATKYTQLKPEHISMIDSFKTFNLIDLITANDESVADYSPIATKFGNRDMIYHFDAFNCGGSFNHVVHGLLQ